MILIPVLIISLVPAVLIFFYLRGLRKDDVIYRQTCNKLLRNGILCCLGVVLLAFLLNILWSIIGIGKAHPLLNAFFHDFILAAFAEEFVKYHAAMREVKKSSSPLTATDTVAFFGIVAIGFDLIESVIYFFGTNLMEIIVRGLSIPHVAYGFIMGWFVHKAISTGKRSYIIPGFLIPWLLHGAYDFFLSEEISAINDDLGMISLLLVFIDLVIIIVTLLKIRKAQKEKNSQAEEAM